MGFFSDWGLKSEMLGKEEGEEENRTEAPSGLSRGGWSEYDERKGEMAEHKVGFEL